MSILEALSLRKTFPPTVALADASLTVERGETVAICGPSGSGKSTLLALLGLLDVPTAGSYLIDGTNVVHLNQRDRTRLRRMRIGFVFQSFHLISHLTAAENVMVALEAKGVPNARHRAAAMTALEQVGLSERLGSFPATLSGGEQQRVAIARATAARPPVLLCDEPTGNLDTSTSTEVMDILLDGGRDAAVVVVTHDSSVAARCSRTAWVRDGVLTGRATSPSGPMDAPATGDE